VVRTSRILLLSEDSETEAYSITMFTQCSYVYPT
jgi:hypothetical protein